MDPASAPNPNPTPTPYPFPLPLPLPLPLTLSPTRWIKLIDLGAAGLLQAGDADGGGLSELCGTPLYAAPEVTPWFYVKTDEQAARCRRYGKEVDH